MTKKLFLLLFLLLLPVSVPAPSAADSAIDTLIDRVMEAYGGKKLEKVTSYRMVGKITARMRNSEASMVRTFVRPDRLRVELEYSTTPETRILNGKQGWRADNRGSLVSVDSFRLQAMVLQAARANLPWVLMERSTDLRTTPAIRLGGQEMTGLELTLGPGQLLRAYIDPETHLIIRSQGILNNPRMRTHFETVYADFQTVDGVLVPHREENFASGHHTGTTVIDKVTLEPEIGPGTFRPE